MKKMLMGLFVLYLFVLPAFAGIIHVEAVIDGKSELVISPSGLFWHHINNAKPGNYGNNYEIAGPTYFNGTDWTPAWTTPPAQRVEDVSDIFSIDTTLYSGFRLSSDYHHYFDEYPHGTLVNLGASVYPLNRGSVTSSEYNGFSSILINDPSGGQHIYSFDILVPEPMTLGVLFVGFMGIVSCRSPRKFSKNCR